MLDQPSKINTRSTNTDYDRNCEFLQLLEYSVPVWRNLNGRKYLVAVGFLWKSSSKNIDLVVGMNEFANLFLQASAL